MTLNAIGKPLLGPLPFTQVWDAWSQFLPPRIPSALIFHNSEVIKGNHLVLNKLVSLSYSKSPNRVLEPSKEVMHGVRWWLPFTDLLAQLITNLLPRLSSVCASLADYRWLEMSVTPCADGFADLPVPLSLGWAELLQEL